ncbi:MAG: biopolymer transporter ExbD [Bdellovibrio sp.]|nr:biopolymer transporter ExbD [Bdellovibrio sp.]
MRSRFAKPPILSDEMALQITSMADIFTIILVFLLKSYASVNISPSTGVTIPVAVAEAPQVEALKLEISDHSVLLENKPIDDLNAFRFPPDDLLPNHSSKKINESLQLERKRQELISQANSSVKPDSKILIIADQKTPYSTLKTVLASAAINGFTDYKLVVVTKD